MGRNVCKFALFLLLFCAAMPKSEAKCHCNCQLDYRPVCAEDTATKIRETFPNECMMQCYGCTHDKHYVIRFRQACESTSTSKNPPKSEL